MASNIKPGDRVIIEIDGPEIFEGTVQRILEGRVVLDNIFCQSTNSNYVGHMIFYRNEITKIAILTTFSKPQVTPPRHEEKSPLMSSNLITLDKEEFERLRKMTFNFTFIDTFGKSFKDALEVLSNRESVAVVGVGDTVKRGKPLSLLLIADFENIYIFDLFCLVQLKELQDVLENKFICKVVHDGSSLYDCLYHKYNVEMQNIFDTQIVDSMISSPENPGVIHRNISECLTHHFNFPPALLSAALEDMVDKTWQERRPIPRNNKIKTAQLGVYLLTLKDKLMSHILKPYTDKIMTDYVQLKNRSDFDLLKFKTK